MLNLIAYNQSIIDLLLLFIGFGISGILIYVKIISIIEQEYRTAKVSFLLSVILFVPFLMIYLYDFPFKEIISIILLAIVVLIIIFLFLPVRPKIRGGFQIPKEKHDEK